MKMNTISDLEKSLDSSKKNDGCLGYSDREGDYDCGYQTIIICEECKYSGCGGRKDPAAKRNQLK
jgi:hypothetical protein